MQVLYDRHWVPACKGHKAMCHCCSRHHEGHPVLWGMSRQVGGVWGCKLPASKGGSGWVGRLQSRLFGVGVVVSFKSTGMGAGAQGPREAPAAGKAHGGGGAQGHRRALEEQYELEEGQGREGAGTSRP